MGCRSFIVPLRATNGTMDSTAYRSTITCMWLLEQPADDQLLDDAVREDELANILDDLRDYNEIVGL